MHNLMMTVSQVAMATLVVVGLAKRGTLKGYPDLQIRHTPRKSSL